MLFGAVETTSAIGAWGGTIELNNISFNDFTEKTKCGGRQFLIKRNPKDADYIPIHIFKNTIIRNVEENAFIWITDPNPEWANDTDCGKWPCTGPSNIVLKFQETQYEGVTRPMHAASDFEVVSNI